MGVVEFDLYVLSALCIAYYDYYYYFQLLGSMAFVAHMRPVATHVACSVVCVFVCVLVTRMSPANTADAIWGLTRMGSRNHALDRIELLHGNGQL